MPHTKLDIHIAAFLDTIAKAEGTSSNPLTQADGYDVLPTGLDGPAIFTDCVTHPYADGSQGVLVEPRTNLVRSLPIMGSKIAESATGDGRRRFYSTESGRYHITAATWMYLSTTYSLGNFGPRNQDLGCVRLLQEAKAIAPLMDGKPEIAVERAADIWDSLPGGLCHEGKYPLLWVLSTYVHFLHANSK